MLTHRLPQPTPDKELGPQLINEIRFEWNPSTLSFLYPFELQRIMSPDCFFLQQIIIASNLLEASSNLMLRLTWLQLVTSSVRGKIGSHHLKIILYFVHPKRPQQLLHANLIRYFRQYYSSFLRRISTESWTKIPRRTLFVCGRTGCLSLEYVYAKAISALLNRMKRVWYLSRSATLICCFYSMQ